MSAVFNETTAHSPTVSLVESKGFGGLMCEDYASASASWDCTRCLKMQSCGFCSSPSNKVISYVLSFLQLPHLNKKNWHIEMGKSTVIRFCKMK